MAWTNIWKALIDEYATINNIDINLNEIGIWNLNEKGNFCNVSLNYAVKYKLAKLAEQRFETCQAPIQYKNSLDSIQR